MSNNPIKVYVIDDKIPKPAKFVNKSIFDKKIEPDILIELLKDEWTDLPHLKKLLENLVQSDEYINGKINLSAFLDPTFCLNEIEEGDIPDILIYDWEYGTHDYEASSNFLKEILEESPNSFAFVYSHVRGEIPPFLNTEEFAVYAARFQLLAKGNAEDSIFSSEEFIYQTIMNRVSDSFSMNLHGINVDFHENGFLKSASDILYLERLFGRANLIQKIKDCRKIIDESTVKEILDANKGFLYWVEEKKALVSPDENDVSEQLRSMPKMSFSEVASKYSLVALEEALERGIYFLK